MATATEPDTIFLRVPPQLKSLIVARVDELNKSKPLGAPDLTINQFAIGILAAVFNNEPKQPGKAVRGPQTALKLKKPAGKKARK